MGGDGGWRDVYIFSLWIEVHVGVSAMLRGTKYLTKGRMFDGWVIGFCLYSNVFFNQDH